MRYLTFYSLVVTILVYTPTGAAVEQCDLHFYHEV